MRIAYLDCFSGISGDMFLGALLDAGVPFELFEKTIAGLDIGATLERSQVQRAGLAATKLDVIVAGERDMPREEFWVKRGSSDGGAGVGVHSHAHSRSLSEILSIISSAAISERARQLANEMFLALATAEAKIHNAGLEDIHFHEVGAADAIVDIVCAAVGAEALTVDEFVCSPLNVGSGTVTCAHGTFPVPAPATLELLKGAPIYSGEIQKELVTPTGAAIVKVLASRFGPRPTMTTEIIGYGAGARDFSGYPNVLRISIGELATTEVAAHTLAREESIAILEANLDDLSPQLIGYIVDKAFAEGALDVFTTPVQMKKSRPGTLLTILAPLSKEETLRTLLFRESSTLGVRVRHEARYVLPRHHESVVTPWGDVRMKVASVNGAASQYAPEYEDCRRIATEHHVPLKHVMQEALQLYINNQR
jgi:uncharacterized protein (TIGR00299 family) protein